MNETITVTAKKEFIKWFLSHYELQKREATWLLQYLMSDDRLLSKVHFTDSIRHLPKAVLMSTKCVKLTPFKYCKNKRVILDVEKAFHDIRLRPDEDVYISLHFRDRELSPEYAAVLEANPMEKQNVLQDTLLGLLAELVLDELIYQYKKEWIQRQIDHALDNKDQGKFFELTEELKSLKRANES
ncbi:ReoY family proteolytic degradation factor [Microaerobacter geothermalis]|uniref:ReoY family proteolytic degradation factor n=1 Tax=Microaerobacter geothermalis TaxID=674972 RepID=UPI001F367583|nr:ReoY family proteolytic degradation factor [Microaerobacter geothermalis]MCF6093366.1 ReoY family proteolytic degradation factor [Microaerobacter geothermalis]